MTEKWPTSRALLERARLSLAGGVSSPFRARAPVPLYFRDGCGSRLEDVDGNSYIDYALAWGPNILGYRHPALVEALTRAAQGPHVYGAQHELEIQVAEKIRQLVPCCERVTFTCSGSEAVQLAWRLARAFTGRELVVRFEGHYHGWMDSVLFSYRPAPDQVGPAEAPLAVPGSRGQVHNAADNVMVLRWNSVEQLEQVFARRGREIAAVAMEPVMCNSGGIAPAPGYLEAASELCRRHGALLLFDEVITGFRMALGGAQSHYGVTPDLATFGKAVAGGPPLSVVGGRREVMEQMVDGGVAFGGTFNGNPLSLAGAAATLRELENGALARAHEVGGILLEGIREVAQRHHERAPLLVLGFPASLALHFTTRREMREYRDMFDNDLERSRRFVKAMLAEGIHLLPDARMYVSAAHSEADVAETVAAFDRVLSSI